jgi:hypothetical protein
LRPLVFPELLAQVEKLKQQDPRRAERAFNPRM